MLFCKKQVCWQGSQDLKLNLTLTAQNTYLLPNSLLMNSKPSCQLQGVLTWKWIVQACYGHTEGTAGITGALLALTTLQQQTCTPVLNLRSINPYVQAALADWTANGKLSPMAPRQLMPGSNLSCHDSSLPGMRQGQPAAGTSSFGMSGVNAHLIMTPPPTPLEPMHEPPEGSEIRPAGIKSHGSSFRRVRFWGAPRTYAIMARFGKLPIGTNGTAEVVIIGRLDTPRLAFLWDHEVMGRPLLAGAAMLEAALATAGAIMAADGNMDQKVAINGASIMAPYIRSRNSAADFCCQLNLR